MPDAPPTSIRRDIASAYVAAAARVLGWAVVSALIYRYIGPVEFALFALVRATLGLLNYTAMGLGPAMVRMLAEAAHPRSPLPVLPLEDGGVSYRTPEYVSPITRIYGSAMWVALLSVAAGTLITILYGSNVQRVHEVPTRLIFPLTALVGQVGLAFVIRLLSDAPGAVLQTQGRIVQDNRLLAVSEFVWVALCAVLVIGTGSRRLHDIGTAMVAASLFLLVGRWMLASRVVGYPRLRRADDRTALRLLGYGSLVVVSQLADFLYAPVDFILINRFLDNHSVAAYAPAVQIDGALLLLVGGLAAVLLPRSAVAHAAGDFATVRRYYLRATAAGFALLLAAALAVHLLSPWLFRLWLGEEMPRTRALLPLVLIHTVVGGSSAVGRSILLAMGRARAYAAAALIAGVANVLLSYCFVKFLNLGLDGIVYATIAVVAARCAVWMPWYVLRALREDAKAGKTIDAAAL